MDDSQATSLEQIRTLVAANEVVRFCRTAAPGSIRLSGADTDAVRLCRPAEARQGRGAALSRADDRFEPRPGDAPDRCLSTDGKVVAAPYQWTRSPSVYTAADVTLLAYVYRAHGNLSGPATRRMLEREYREYGQAAYQRLSGISVAHLYRLRNTAAYRKRNTSYQPMRPTPVPSASGASRGHRLTRIPAHRHVEPRR